MAKLPQINYGTSTPRLARPPAGGPAQVAAAQLGLGREIGNLANVIGQQAAAHQSNEARSNAHRRMAEHQKQHEGREFYSADELREMGVEEDIIQDRDSIPSYEVNPGLYLQKYEQVIAEESSKISFAGYKDRFVRLAQNDMYAQHARQVVAASKAQIKQQNAQIMTAIDELIIDREYDFAHERVKELRIGSAQKTELRNKIRANEEYSSYVDMVNYRNRPAAMEALKSLTTEPSKNLDEETQYKAIRMLENFLAEDTTAQSLARREALDKLKRIQKAAIAGKYINLEYYNDVVIEAKELGVEPRHFKHTATAVKANRFARGIANLPADEQTQAMQDRNLSKKTIEGGIEADYMESIVKGNISAMQKDMLSYYHSINGNIPTIPFLEAATEPGKTAAFLADRMRRHDVAEDRLKVSQGYLKNTEADVLADLLLTASDEDIISFTQEVNAAMGRNGAHLFDQLRVKRKELGSLTVVGQLAMIGAPTAAQQVLKGHTYRKNNPEVIQALQEDFLPKIHEYLDGAYSNTPRYLSTLKNAILDVYAIKAVEQGHHIDPMTDSGAFLGFGDGLLEDSVNTVTGGLIEHGDNTIEPPYYGAPQAVMDNWLENLSPDYLVDEEGNSKVHHYSPKQVIKSLNDEDFQLESIGYGRYVIQTGKGGYLASSDGLKKFVLEFDMNAPIVNQSDTEVYLDTIPPAPIQGPGDFIIESEDWVVDPAEWGVEPMWKKNAN